MLPIANIIALVLFLLSIVWSIVTREYSSVLFAVWAIAAQLILPGLIKR